MRAAYGRRQRCEELEGQLSALPARHYEVGVVDRWGITRRVWRAREVAGSYAWLAKRNHRGAHVVLRPAGTEFVLIDDVGAGGLGGIGRAGLVPAAVVETAPARFQVWLRFPEALPRELASCVAQVLARRHDAGVTSAHFRHLGRAVGFMNRKREHRDGEGRFPWVRLAEATGEVTPNTDGLVVAGRERMAELEARRREAEECAREGRRADGQTAGRAGKVLQERGGNGR